MIAAITRWWRQKEAERERKHQARLYAELHPRLAAYRQLEQAEVKGPAKVYRNLLLYRAERRQRVA